VGVELGVGLRVGLEFAPADGVAAVGLPGVLGGRRLRVAVAAGWFGRDPARAKVAAAATMKIPAAIAAAVSRGPADHRSRPRRCCTDNAT
jgi:hypothetical protein